MKPMERLLLAIASGLIVWYCIRLMLPERKPKNINILVTNTGTFHLEVHDPTNQWWINGTSPVTNRDSSVDIADRAENPPGRRSLKPGPKSGMTNKTSSIYEKTVQTQGEQPQAQSTRSMDDIMHDIANSYFRIGQQAALMARGFQDEKEREINIKYGDYVNRGRMVTNRDDFEVLSNPLVAIDDPRIFDALRKAQNGSVLGLDTNDWSNRKWTVLKD